MNTWPISKAIRGGWTYLGIPDRLGDGGLWKPGDAFPTLEEVVEEVIGRGAEGGTDEDWSASVLAAILPAERAWAWWTRTQVYQSAKLPTTSAPDDIDLGALDAVVARRLTLAGMTLAFVPARDLSSQETVRYWAGMDVEQIPDHIWTAPEAPRWHGDEIVTWCRDVRLWSDPTSVSRLPAERIVTLFDNQIFWAGTEHVAAVVASRLEELAARWKLSIIDGPTAYASPTLAETAR